MGPIPIWRIFSIPTSQALAEILLPTPPPHFSRGGPGIILMPKASPLPRKSGGTRGTPRPFIKKMASIGLIFYIMFIIIFAGKENICKLDILCYLLIYCHLLIMYDDSCTCLKPRGTRKWILESVLFFFFCFPVPKLVPVRVALQFQQYGK